MGKKREKFGKRSAGGGGEGGGKGGGKGEGRVRHKLEYI